MSLHSYASLKGIGPYTGKPGVGYKPTRGPKVTTEYLGTMKNGDTLLMTVVSKKGKMSFYETEKNKKGEITAQANLNFFDPNGLGKRDARAGPRGMTMKDARKLYFEKWQGDTGPLGGVTHFTAGGKKRQKIFKEWLAQTGLYVSQRKPRRS
jgi:hypothetical protein